MKRPTEAYADLGFPVNGLDQSAGFQSQRPMTTRIGRNVRTFEPLTQRGRGGQRPGLSEYVPAAVPAGAVEIQNLATVVTVSQQALPWSFSYPFLNLADPSSPGLPFLWGPGRFSRVPPLLLPPDGWLFQPAKNLPKPVKIVWGRPSDIVLGTALGATQLNAVAQDAITGASVAGSFAYKPASGALLPLGQNDALSSTFTAADPANYQSGIVTANAINVLTALPNPITFVQQTSSVGGSPGTVSMTFSSGSISGNLILVSAMVETPATANVQTPTDSAGNHYTLLASVSFTDDTGAKWALYLWRAFAGTNAALTISVTTTGSPIQSNVYTCGLEYANVSSVQPVDTSGTFTGSGGTISAGPLTAAALNEMLFGVLGSTHATFMLDSPATDRSGSGFMQVGDIIGVSQNTPVSITETAQGVPWATIAVLFNRR